MWQQGKAGDLLIFEKVTIFYAMIIWDGGK